MRDITEPYGLCSIDPVSAILGGVGTGIVSSIFGGGADKAPAAPTPTAPESPQTAIPATQAAGTKPQVKSSTPTFLGSSALPSPTQTGQKTLLGQ